MSNKEEIKTTYTAANGFAMPSTTKAKTKTEKPMTIVVRQTVVVSVRVPKQTMTRVMPLYYMRIRIK